MSANWTNSWPIFGRVSNNHAHVCAYTIYVIILYVYWILKPVSTIEFVVFLINVGRISRVRWEKNLELVFDKYLMAQLWWPLPISTALTLLRSYLPLPVMWNSWPLMSNGKALRVGLSRYVCVCVFAKFNHYHYHTLVEWAFNLKGGFVFVELSFCWLVVIVQLQTHHCHCHHHSPAPDQSPPSRLRLQSSI